MRATSPRSTSSSSPVDQKRISSSYQIPAFLNFVPGGILYPPEQESSKLYFLPSQDPAVVIKEALKSDNELNRYSKKIMYPSLSCLAEAVFGAYTGVSASNVRHWADSMITSVLGTNEDLFEYLASLPKPSEAKENRPCGYVFRRGDIAWNCRTCQTDSTCVICDECFRNSDHEGHDVFFHRTSPGGCCDCGDVEAWNAKGCCPKHRPSLNKEEESLDDDMEAVKASWKSRLEGSKAIRELPIELASVLGVVIGAAIRCCIDAIDGAAIGADSDQWRLRYAEQVCYLSAGVAFEEDWYYHRSSEDVLTPSKVLSESCDLPTGFRLFLRLHNDDVHTFDEVIDALHDPMPTPAGSEDVDSAGGQRLVPSKENADEMTHHVDSDGQVTVRSYTSFQEAFIGFKRLKQCGLHCSVVSTPQVDLEYRAKVLSGWLRDIASTHPAVTALVVHGLVDVTFGREWLGGVCVSLQSMTVPIWAIKNRLETFHPSKESSYLSREEARKLYGLLPIAMRKKLDVDESFYNFRPFELPSRKLLKSPHSLWGTLLLPCENPCHPCLRLPNKCHPCLPNNKEFDLQDSLLLVDTDLRKQQEVFKLTSSLHPHQIAGLHLISGVALSNHQSPPTHQILRPILHAASFRSPFSPILLLLLLDPYPPKQLRSSLHALFLSLLVDPRFRSRFAAALGGVAYRPLSTLFCAGVGTEADTPLGFTVQILTAGSLVRALNHPNTTRCLLESDELEPIVSVTQSLTSTFTLPIALSVVRVVHTNLLGATKEVKMVVKNTSASSAPSLTYQPGEHPLTTLLPVAPDDGFLDSRTTRHKRIPHLLRDLEYILMTPGTSLKVIQDIDISPLPPLLLGEPRSNNTILDFPTVWSRMLRLGMGMDPQKRKISGGHVEFENRRWIDAFGLVLNLAGTRDALMTATSSCTVDDEAIWKGTGNILRALLREIKLWLYREGLLETGFPMPVVSTVQTNMGQLDQRSTLHWNAPSSNTSHHLLPGGLSNVALSCAKGVKMTEIQLELIEYAIKSEEEEYQEKQLQRMKDQNGFPSCRGALLGDWLRVPHSPLMGDSLTFYLPLYRALARCIKSFCSIIVPDAVRKARPNNWWKLPCVDGNVNEISDAELLFDQPCTAEKAISSNPIAASLRPCLRSSNCRVVWSSGPDCTPAQAQRRRAHSRSISSSIASAKVIHSLCDHPLRCLAASQQIERHLWARNGDEASGMAYNYASSPIRSTFRDLDLTLVQLSASGFYIGLGPRRTFSLLMSRFSMDGYLCDPQKRSGSTSSTLAVASISGGNWVHPPRLQDPEHAVALAEAFFSTICLLVTELPGPPPSSIEDDSSLRRTMRRELIHALAAEPRSYSEALAAASTGIQRKEKNDSFRIVFSSILKEISTEKQRGSSQHQASRGSPPTYQLKANCSDEYDPTFFHLKRIEHQHAMDTVARLRKQKLNSSKNKKLKQQQKQKCLPLVSTPPPAHLRFLPCRLILHLPYIDAALRRALLFALLGGQWLPPPEPAYPTEDASSLLPASSGESDAGSRNSSASSKIRRGFRNFHSSSFHKNSKASSGAKPFSPAVVAASSVSFLEVLQVLTLQVHTLEECASLHQTHDMEEESRHLSSSLSINSYLSRLIHVPSNLEECWVLRCPDPLPSAGTGSYRGSILGFLIALYEHRNDHGVGGNLHGGQDGEESGGARALVADGLKWLLRFVGALVDGAPSVSSASQSAIMATPIRGVLNSAATSWSISPSIRAAIKGMLSNLPELWPKDVTDKDDISTGTNEEKASTKSNGARKAAQRRALEMMRKQQASFAASIETIGGSSQDEQDKKNIDCSSNNSSFEDLLSEISEDEEDLCIICRCDDKDGHDNGPLGYLGHVQRSRALQLRNMAEIGSSNEDWYMSARVVGDKGCQLRISEDMDSTPVACLPTGTIVNILESKVSSKYDLLSRRVFVQHASDKNTKGWASVQSSQGYVILSPLAKLCYNNTRWGATRPLVKLCGHAAHLGCVEAHCLSLHQRAGSDQPYDGRFAANIDEGEFLCPLCKQLSNVLVPKGSHCGFLPSVFLKRNSLTINADEGSNTPSNDKSSYTVSLVRQNSNASHLRKLIVEGMQFRFDDYFSMGPKISAAMNKIEKEREATRRFGAHLLQGMQASWENMSNNKKSKKWHSALSRWDYEEDATEKNKFPNVGKILHLLRQQHIAWGTVGYGAAIAEASVRGVSPLADTSYNSSNPLIVADPWTGYDSQSRDSHPMLLELRRILTATSSLLDVLNFEMIEQLHVNNEDSPEPALKGVSLIGELLGNIIEGVSALEVGSTEIREEWRPLMAFLSSMPCHLSRDGCLSSRHEARATAAEMWAIKGLNSACSKSSSSSSPQTSSSERKKNRTSNSLPPTPLCVRKVCNAKNCKLGDTSEPPMLLNSWGTLDPADVASSDYNPFRPAIASSFLYIPILAWDLNSFAGALYSSLLLYNDIDNVLQSQDLIVATRILLVARLIQILITPYGIPNANDTENIKDFFFESGYWSEVQVEVEGRALKELRDFCLKAVNRFNSTPDIEIDPTLLLRNVSLAILPYTRTLLLMLRACSSTLRQRNRQARSFNKTLHSKPSPSERTLDSVLESPHIMKYVDGLRIMSLFGCPLPSSLNCAWNENNVDWNSLIKKWLGSLLSLEDHHGSRGKGFIYNKNVNCWVPSFVDRDDNILGIIANSKQNQETSKSSNGSDAVKNPSSVFVNDSHEVEVVDFVPNVELSSDRENTLTKNINHESLSNDTVNSNEDMIEGSVELQINDNNDTGNNSFEMLVNDNTADMDEEVNDDETFGDRLPVDLVFDLLHNQAVISNDDESDDEAEMSEDDDAMVLDVTLGGQGDDGALFFGRRTTTRHVNIPSELQNQGISDEENSISLSSNSAANDDETPDTEFVSLSRASIIPYQPSLIGQEIGPGPRGLFFEYNVVNNIMSDLSHMGMVHHLAASCSGLVRLPRSFVELYSLVNKVKGRDTNYGGTEELEDGSSTETAICLLTGSIMRSGSSRRHFSRGITRRPPGACTVHARKFGSGIGIFFLIQKCTVLLIHNNKSAYSASIYVDEHGEEDPGLRRGRPLYLKETRYAVLETLWRQHGIPREVAQIRSTSDRVIRDNWY